MTGAQQAFKTCGAFGVTLSDMRNTVLSRRAFVGSLSLVLAGCATSPRATADIVLLSQPTVTDGAKVGLGFYSSSHARPTRNYKRGDDFRLATAAEVTRFRWWGLSEGRVFDDLRNFDQYTIEIYEGERSADAGPLPGTLLWSHTYQSTSLSIAATGRASATSGAAEYVYEASVPGLLSLDRGRDYILAVSARSINTRGDAWQWQDGELFGGHGANYSYASRQWSAFQDTDSAFEIIGRPIPAPGAALVLSMLATRRAGRRARGA